MRFDNYYLSEYRRVLDNIKINEAKLMDFAENIDKNIEVAKSAEAKRLAVVSATAVMVGIGVGLALRKRR
jgi:hypothetical protein